MNIDPKNVACFGFTLPRKESWYVLLHSVSSNGWKSIDNKVFEKSLNDNVKFTYENMVSLSFTDLDTDIDYIAGFDNKLKLWNLIIPNSSAEALDPKDKKEFFKSDIFKKTCKRADEILTNAYKSCENMIIPEVKTGRFINLDEIKLEAIMDMLNDPTFRRNLKLGKFVK